jgi:6-phosphogluconolactonase (cycloisomerase 2 family)
VSVGTSNGKPFVPGAKEYVYVESNIKTSNGNSVYAFERQPDGSLKQVQGSPFATGGAGVQDESLKVGPSDSDQDIVTNSDHSLLFAVNSGSDTIAVFKIKNDGSLQAVEGSPFWSGGTNPVSLAFTSNYLVVVNKNGDFARMSNELPNYTVFHVTLDGKLSPVEHSTVDVALGSSPTQALLVPGTDLVFGADFLGGLLQSFRLSFDGYLRQRGPLGLPASEFPDPTAPRLPLGLWSHPNQPLLYVGFVTVNRLGVYSYTANGRLKFLRTVPNSGQAICWLRTNRAGTRLYSTDTGTNSVSVYDLSQPEEPREVQNVVLSGPGNVLQFSLSDNERYLYALSSRGSANIPEGQGNRLHVLQIEGDGSVSELVNDAIDFALPPGTRPQGVETVTVR